LFLNPHAMVGASIVQSSRTVRLSAGAELRTLGDEDLFAYLCIHGACHWWNRLQWLADINALLTATDRRIEQLIAAATARGAGRAVDQALLLCNRLFATSLPATVLRRSKNSAITHWLEATALRAMTFDQGEHEPRDARFGTTRGSLSTLLLNRSLRYRLAELRVHLINETDVLTFPLPKRLWFVYPFLRLPLWLWRHAAKRSVPPGEFRSI
jgi:putative nucleotidyltransferase-like protein